MQHHVGTSELVPRGIEELHWYALSPHFNRKGPPDSQMYAGKAVAPKGYASTS